ARAIGLRRRELAGIPDQCGVARFSVLAGRSVAGFARFAVPAAFLFAFHYEVRTFLEPIEDVFVASLADLRSDISRGLGGGFRGLGWFGFGSFLCSSVPHEPERCHKERAEGRRAAALMGADHLISLSPP